MVIHIMIIIVYINCSVLLDKTNSLELYTAFDLSLCISINIRIAMYMNNNNMDITTIVIHIHNISSKLVKFASVMPTIYD